MLPTNNKNKLATDSSEHQLLTLIVSNYAENRVRHQFNSNCMVANVGKIAVVAVAS